MKKILLKKTIKELNKKQKKNIGCVNSFINITFVAILFIIIILLFVAAQLEKNDEGLQSLLVSSIVFVIAIRVIGFFFQKVLNGVFKKNMHTGTVRVRVEKAVVTNKTSQREYSYVPLSDPHKLKCQMYFENEREKFSLNVGAITFSKHNIGDEVYIISIDNQYYGDMIFKTNQYELDEDGQNALKEEIYIKI